MKKQFLFLVVAMLLSVASVFAQGGTWGPLTWKISGDTLTINGIGAMPDVYFAYTGPWCDEIHEPDGGVAVSCPFRTVIIEEGVTSIGNRALGSSSNMKSISIANSVTRIGNGAFVNSGLPLIVIPNSVTSIEAGAFAACEVLTSVTIPNRAVDFGINVFLKCTALTSITNLNPIPQSIDSDVFGDLDVNTITLYVPKNSVNLYKNAAVWRGFNIVGIEVDIEEIETKSGSGDQLLVYPNPATGVCSITMPEEFLYERFLTLSVYDTSGKLIQQIQIDNDDPEKVSLKLDHKAQGVYVVTLSNGVRSFSGKVVFN